VAAAAAVVRTSYFALAPSLVLVCLGFLGVLAFLSIRVILRAGHWSGGFSHARGRR
jgi:hypothetical protein